METLADIYAKVHELDSLFGQQDDSLLVCALLAWQLGREDVKAEVVWGQAGGEERYYVSLVGQGIHVDVLRPEQSLDHHLDVRESPIVVTDDKLREIAGRSLDPAYLDEDPDVVEEFLATLRSQGFAMTADDVRRAWGDSVPASLKVSRGPRGRLSELAERAGQVPS